MPLLKEEYTKEEKINGVILCDRKHLKGGSYTGTPRFIVETLSPATALRDKTVKNETIKKIN